MPTTLSNKPSQVYVYVQSFLLLFIAYLLGRWNFSIYTILGFVTLLVMALFMEHKQRAFHAILRFQSQLTDSQSLQKSLTVLPSWITFPELEKVEFLQETITLLWPYVKEAVQSMLLEMLPPIVNASLPAVISGIDFAKLDFGPVPPTVDGVKLYSDGTKDSNEIMFDIPVEFRGSPTIIIEVKRTPLTMPVSIVDFSFASTIRVVLKPLITKIPCIGAVAISLVKKPKISFRLEALVPVNIMSLPVLNTLLYDIINGQISQQLLWPKRLLIPLQKLDPQILETLKNSKSLGILSISIPETKDIHEREAYASLSLGSQKKKIELSSKDGGNSGMEADFLVTDPRTETLVITVKALENLVKSTLKLGGVLGDKVKVGDCEIPILRFCESTEPKTMWVPLSNVTRGKGQMRVILHWKPYLASSAKDANNNDHPTSSTTDTSESKSNTVHRGVLGVTVHKASHLARPKGLTNIDPFGSVDPYVKLTVGKTEFRTESVANTTSPTWEAPFEFNVSDIHSQMLHLQVHDKNRYRTDVLLGELMLPIHVLNHPKKTDTYPLTNGSNATITLTTTMNEY